ncbi:MAG TPA: SBBP repeat-containing protein [Anaerolineales bacterium]|nr:SBBP repeat-containing protein [Anaerolineales bacterium]
MFANNQKAEVVIRVLLIVMIVFNPLTSSTVFAQKNQGSISVTSPNTQKTGQENASIPTAGLPNNNIESSVESQQTADTKSTPSTIFIENVGQFDQRAEFLVQGSNANIYLAQNEIWFTIIEGPKKEKRQQNTFDDRISQKEKVKAVNLKMVFPGSNPNTKLEGFDRIDVNVSYFIGSDSKQQFTNVPVWGGVRYKDLYPGADLELRSENGAFVWQIVVKDSLRFVSSDNYISSHGLGMKIAGQKQLKMDGGKVNIDTELRNFILPTVLVKGSIDTKILSKTPKVIGDQLFLIYPKTLSINSTTDGLGKFTAFTTNQIGQSTLLQTQESNLSRLLFARLLGLGADDEYSGAYAHAVGPDGSMYITGQTFSANFPILAGYHDELSGIADAFVVKLNPDGSLGYATYFGGAGYDSGNAIAVNQNGEVYIAGYTTSYDDLPRTADALVTNSNGFLTKLSAGGNQLLYSSYVGSGETRIWDVGIDAAENVYVLDNGWDSSRPAKVYKFEPGNSTYDYVYTWAPGTFGYGGMTVGANGYVYLTSGSAGHDVSVTSLTDSGTVSYSISFGGTNMDWGNEIAVDQEGYAYVIGITYSSDFPGEVIPEDICSSCKNTLVAIISPTGALQYSARIEGVGGIQDAIAIDRQGQIYLIGSTDELLLPVTADAVWEGNQGDSQDIGDVVVVRLTPSMVRGGYSITYITAVGGTGYDWVGLSGAVDDSGNIFLSGETDSTDFIGYEGGTFVQEKAFAVKISTEPVQIEITDSAGNPVSVLSLNSDGWPTPNPLTVNVTFYCPTGGLDCNHYAFDFNLTSSSGSSRFFPYYSTRPPDGSNCIGDYPNAQYTLATFELSCSDIPLIAGQTVSYMWKLWVQPSDMAQLNVQAQYGAYSNEKVISIPKAAIHPAVLIPGDGVSNQFISNTYYDSLLVTLEKMGYQRGQTLFPWDYNPIDSFVDTAEDFANNYMPVWQADAVQVPWVWNTPGNQNQTSFDLMAHSAGVMVTRAYVQLTPVANYTPVNKLLLVGGTNKGILSNYAAREGLRADNLVFQFLLGPVLAQKSIECGNYMVVPGPIGSTFVATDKDKYLTLHDRSCGILSAPEQLPAPGPNDPEYLEVANNSTPYPYPAFPGSPNGYQYNPLLQGQPTDLTIYPMKDPWWLPTNTNPGTTYYNLNGTILADLAERNIPVQNLHIFYSDNIETDQTYKVTDPSAVSPLWRNGIWSGEDDDTTKGPGDDAVATYSALAPDLWPGYTPHRLVFPEAGTDSRPEKHGNLMVYPESQQEIGLTMSGIKPPFLTSMNAINEFFQSQGNPRVINGFGLSPIELLVTDPQGRRLGYDPGSGQILNEIPLGVYVHPTGEPVEFVVYAPQAGNYTITVTGTGNGPYTLLDVFTDEHASVPILFEQHSIQQGQTYTTTMAVPASSGDVPYPPDVNAGIDISTVVGTQVQFSGTIKDINPNDTFTIQWDFGDGSTASETLTPTHTYSVPGTYTVTLTVTDTSGFTVNDTLVVTITQPAACTPSNSYSSSQGAFQFASFKLTSNLTNFDRLPLSFVPNMGQEDAAVKFQVQGLGGNLFFTPGEVVFSLPNPVKIKEDDKDKIRYDLHPANVLRIQYQGANENPQIAGLQALPGVANYLIGNDPSQWRTNVPTYSGIAYRELYPGIELRYEGTDGKLKSTFYVAPGVDPSAIVWKYKEAENVVVGEAGNLVITLPSVVEGEPGKTLIERAPIAWQEANGGTRVTVAVQYAVDKKDKKVSFLLPNGYDSTLPLVIDPTISYSTYLGGTKTDEADAVTLDADCNVYLTGKTSSSAFPTTPDSYQTNRPEDDVFVSKLNAAGDTLLYSTYIGGSGDDHAWDIGLDNQGRITVVGETESSDFPTWNAYDNFYDVGTCSSGPCDDVFVTQLSAQGNTLRYSTYLGGSADDEALAMALGMDDKIYLTGITRSSTFPTVNGYDTSFGGGACDGYPCEDVFVTKVDPALTGAASLPYSTFLGGSNYDRGTGIAIDSAGHVYVTGYTRSDGLATPNAYQVARAGASDIFVTKLDMTLSGSASRLYSTYFGGNNSDHAHGIALHGANQVYLTGSTESSDFPLQTPFDSLLNGLEAFVTHLDISTNTRVYSSYLGGSGEDDANSITMDNEGNAYITGYTKSIDFPLENEIQSGKGADSCSTPPCADAFVTKVNANGTAILYSTYLGGSMEDYGTAIVVDSLGGAYIVGYTYSTNLFTNPTFPHAGASGYVDAFVVKIDD